MTTTTKTATNSATTTTTPRIATSTRPASGSKPAVTVTPAAEKEKTPAGQPEPGKNYKASAALAVSRLIKRGARLQKLFALADDETAVSTIHTCLELALQNLGDVKSTIANLPADWKPAKDKHDKDIHVGDIVNLRDNGKVKAIYAEAILASELDGMVVENVGTRMVRCTTSVSHATVIIPIKHLIKAAPKAQPSAA